MTEGKRLSSGLSIGLFSLSLASVANAALSGVLPATPGGSDWQAYYDDQLDISWTADANIRANINGGLDPWDFQVAWAASLDIDGVTGWRLPNMDLNDDGIVVTCSADQAACKDNEYGHLFSYGSGTVFGGGISPSSPGPFINIQTLNYWSGTEFAPDPTFAWGFNFADGLRGADDSSTNLFAWAVHDGDVSAVPEPLAVWSAASAMIALLAICEHRRRHFRVHHGPSTPSSAGESRRFRHLRALGVG